MTSPLPPAKALPLPYDPPRPASSRPEEGGNAFADILASGIAVRLPGPPPMPEHGPAIVVFPAEGENTGLPETAGMGEVSGKEERGQPQAQRFNQHGFFGYAERLEAPAVRPPVNVASAESPQQPARPISSDRGAGTWPSGDTPLHDSAAGTASRAIVTARLPVVKALSRSADISGPRATLPPATLEEIAEPSRISVRRSHARTPLAGQAAVQVVMRELENGLHIAARVDALSERERERLHDEIAALLARHGLGARHVAISAPPQSPRHEGMK